MGGERPPVDSGFLDSGREIGSPSILRPFRRPLVQASCASFFVQCLGLVPSVALLLVIDRVIVNSAFETLDVIAVGVVLAGGFEFLFARARERLLGRAAADAWSGLMERVYRHLLHRPLAAPAPAESVVPAFEEAGRVRAFVSRLAVGHVTDVVLAVVFTSFLLLVDVRLALIAIAGIPVYALIVLVTLPAVRRRSRRGTASAQRWGFVVNQTVVNLETVRSLALENGFERRWRDLVRESAEAQDAVHRLSGGIANTTELVQRILTAAILWYGAGLVVAQEISLGQLVAFNLIAMRLSAPIIRASRVWPDIQRTRDAVRRIETLFREHLDSDAGKTALTRRPSGEIRFRDVTVRYPAAPAPALEGVDFRIAPGEFVALVGASGAGKSTLVRTLLGLCRPDRGAVLVDGMPVVEIDGRTFRSVVGVVPQHAALFTGTVYDNIALGDPRVRPEDVERSAALAGACEFIERLPDGYRSFVGERGQALSGGQRQRIALARALVRNPAILMLDEATSALDFEEEASFFERIEQARGARTVLAATHRPAAVAASDRILVLRDSRLVEAGTHAELVRAGGVYSAMWSRWLPPGLLPCA
ncbi:MAG: peptidase domain-containing ABC transporter [Immundisolibacterales bacterium]|nr:peptidase domain-containing ABC transporter [Immundisolibacterales bacterium]